MTCKLLELPEEIRLEIYQLLIDPETWSVEQGPQEFDVGNISSFETIPEHEMKSVRTCSVLFAHPIFFAEALSLVLKTLALIFYDPRDVRLALQTRREWLAKPAHVIFDFGKCRPREMKKAIKRIGALPGWWELEVRVWNKACLPAIHATRRLEFLRIEVVDAYKAARDRFRERLQREEDAKLARIAEDSLAVEDLTDCCDMLSEDGVHHHQIFEAQSWLRKCQWDLDYERLQIRIRSIDRMLDRMLNDGQVEQSRRDIQFRDCNSRLYCTRRTHLLVDRG